MGLVDLGTKVISVVAVVLAATFLQHFIRRENPLATLQFGAALVLVSGAPVLLQWNSRLGNEFERARLGRAGTGSRRAVPRRLGGAHHQTRPHPSRPGPLPGAGLPGLIACSL